jgi:hypothetical protein
MKRLIPFLFLAPVAVNAQSWPACDSLFIDCCSIEVDGANTITLYATNYSTNIFSYPGFVLLDGNGDTIAVETVNYFGIGGGSQPHVLDLVNPITLPFTGTVGLWALFYDTLACTIPVSFSDSTLSITQPGEGTIGMYPNPAANVVYIGGDNEPFTLEVLNTSGQLVRRERYHRLGAIPVNVSMLAPGTYILRQVFAHTILQGKLMKQ